MKFLVVFIESQKNSVLGRLFKKNKDIVEHSSLSYLFKNDIHHIYQRGLEKYTKETHHIYLGTKQIISLRKSSVCT